MKIAILGTRGIPNNYGGFEQFAEYLSEGLTLKGHEVYVYSPHNHKHREDKWHGVNIIHKYDPEYKIGTAGQFIYDLNCILDSRKRHFDIILQLGYTSSSVWSNLFPKGSLIVTNMDGLEWRRTKYGRQTQKFLKYAEGLAVKKSDVLVADSLGIKKYLFENYNVQSEYIPYGAAIFNNPDVTLLKAYDLLPYQYDMLIARLEPENNIEMILDGFVLANSDRVFIVVGNNKTSYGNYLVEKYKAKKNIMFLGPIYELTLVNNLRHFSNLYFHGHTVGGTNPSLLEAMASNALIVAHENDFNGSILEGDAFYFSNVTEASRVIDAVTKGEPEQKKIKANLRKINELYSWQIILNSYETLFKKIISNSGKV